MRIQDLMRPAGLAGLMLCGIAAGQFDTTPTVYPTQGIGPLDTALADVDADGDLDLIVLRQSGGSGGVGEFEVYRNDGTGVFTFFERRTTGSDVRSFAVGDWGSDGDLDVAIASRANGAIDVHFNNGNGQFTIRNTLSIGASLSDITSGNLSAGNGPDLAATDITGDRVHVLRNSGGGVFATSVFPTVNLGGNLGNEPRALAATDIDRDGDDDIVVGCGDGFVGLYTNLGGQWATGDFALYFNMGSIIYDVAAARMNADGFEDIVVSRLGGIRVLTNVAGGGDRTYSVGPLVPINTSTSRPTGIAVGDVDGDGDTDVVASDEVFGELVVLLNNGSGGLAIAQEIEIGSSTQAPSLGDLDADGDLDLVGTRYVGQAFVTLTNTTTVVGGPPPVARIDLPSAYPLDGSCLCATGGVVTGVATAPGTFFASYTLAYRPVSGDAFTTFATSSTAVGEPGGTLGVLNTGALAEGFYLIKLTATTRSGLSATDEQVVWVSRDFDGISASNPAVAAATVCVTGTLSDNNCGPVEYIAEYRRTGSGAAYQPFDPSEPVYAGSRINQTIATWDTRALGVPDGTYDIRVTGSNGCGQSETYASQVIVDNTAPEAVIDVPENCFVAEDSPLTIRGTAFDANLSGWSLSYTGGAENGFRTIASGNTNIVNGVLGVWDVSGLEPCAYTLRLTVSDRAVVNCGPNTQSRSYYVSINVGCEGDENGDGVKDIFDIITFFNNFSRACGL